MRGLRPNLFFYLLLLTTIGCQNMNGVGSASKDVENQVLTQKSAQDRADRISSVSYDLAVTLDEKSTLFLGVQKVQFSLSKIDKDIAIDFEGQVRKFTVNGKLIPKPEHYGVFLVIPKDQIYVGPNQVEIEFENNLRTDGVGLHRFVDPTDKRIYIYSQFEPFDANKFAPFFDQPDLKAPLKLTVSAPAEWQVVTATREENVTVNKGQKTWFFKPTPKISTYLYSLHAGPFHQWTASYKPIPMRLFARQSMKNYVNFVDWFKITRQGMEFYQKYFDTPYPFEKYDQLIVPEFNAGAMENVGAVTFSERYLRRGDITKSERQNLANTVLHELSHMWFGNLVTMQWWNDLWLNESFATYMASLAVSENTEFREDAWLEFFNEKLWAYAEDQWVTTHPIEAPVRDTAQAFTNFDGITYGKGAAVIKQLVYFLKPDVFQKGIQSYFKKHAWGNTELNDFTAALEGAANISLQDWKIAWLQSDGVERYSVDHKCSGEGKLASITVKHLSDGPPNPQSFRLGLLYSENNQLVENVTLRLNSTDKKIQTVTAAGLENAKCPQFVFLNSGDHAYAIQNLDQNQTALILQALPQIKDRHLRYQLTHVLWEKVTHAELAPQLFIESVANAIEVETDPMIVEYMLARLVGNGYGRGALQFLAEDPQKKMLLGSIETRLWNLFLAAKNDLNRQNEFFQAVLSVTTMPTLKERLKKYYLGQIQVPGFKLDQDRRWSLLQTLCRLGEADCQKWVHQEAQRDSSDRGEKSKLAALTLQPSAEVKKASLENVLNPKTALSLEQIRSVVSSLFPDDQLPLKAKLDAQITSFIKTELAQRPETFQEVLANSLTTLDCSDVQNEKFVDLVQDVRMGPIPQKAFKVAIQEDSRCVKVRNLAKSYWETNSVLKSPDVQPIQK